MIRMKLGSILTFFVYFALAESANKTIFNEKIEDLKVTILKVDRSLRLNVKWNSLLKNGTKLDISIHPRGENCPNKPCSEYDLPKDINEMTFPTDTDQYVEHSQCLIEPGCIYLVKVSTANRRIKQNATIQIPDCFQNVCSCKHRTQLPIPEITSEMLSLNSLNISWHLPPLGKDLIKNNITLDSIFISVSQGDIPSLTWGGKQTLIDSQFYPINLTAYNSSTTNKYYLKFNLRTNLVEGSYYITRAHIVDKKGCISRENVHKLIVPAIKNESMQVQGSFQSTFTLIVSIVITLGIGLCIGNCIYKSKRKAKRSTDWRSIYQSAPSTGVHQISMEENRLYLDKDILEAQENGKADTFEVPHNFVVLGAILGEGTFGIVYEATVKNTTRIPGKETVAVKQLKKKPKPAADEVEEFLGEIQTMKNVGRHENIVSLLGCCTIKEPLMMIMEFVGQGDLLQYLRNIRAKHWELFRNPNSRSSLPELSPSLVNNFQPPQGKYLELKLSSTSLASDASYIKQPETAPATLRPSVTETMYTMLSQNSTGSEKSRTPSLDYVLDNRELHNFAFQIAKGMRHLEEKGITHRDLAARNVLIDSRKTLKISDFGLSRAGIYVNTKTKKLPLRWLSIEAIRDNLYSSSSDVWAFAIVLWEIGTLGGFPYPTVNNHEILKFLSEGKRLERPEICSELLYNLMLQCWQEDPEKRPTFGEILQLLQPQNQKIYVDFHSLAPDYVFPPTREQVLDSL